MIYAIRYALIALFTVIWGIPACVVGPFDPSGRFVCWVARNWIGWIYAACGIHVVATGVDKIDRSRSYVVMTNHQSVVDIGAIVLTLPFDFRFVAKRELARIPFFGWALAVSIGVMIDRSDNASAVASLRAAADRIRDGANVIIFPEGTRSPTGALQEFKSGGFHLAMQAGVPILPATVSGSMRITPKGSLKVRSGTVKIAYGEAIPTEGLRVEERDALKQQVRDAIQAGFDPAFQDAAASR